MKLRSLIPVDRISDRLRLSDRLNDEALKILVDLGLEKRFSQQCQAWKQESSTVQSVSNSNAEEEIDNLLEKLDTELPALERSLFEAILDEVLRLYP